MPREDIAEFEFSLDALKTADTIEYSIVHLDP